MRKLLLILLLCAPAFATDWYADSGGGDISTRGWHGTSAGSCAVGSGTVLTYASRTAGDIFHANACTSISIAADPGVASVNVTLSTVTGSGAAGGGFTLNTSVGGTMHIDVIAGTTTALTVSGSTAGTPALTISGACTGGTSSGAMGCAINQTVGTVAMTTGPYTAGTAATAHGVQQQNSGPVTVSGNGVASTGSGGSANGVNNGSASGVLTMTGDCKGNDTGFGSGCAANAGQLIVTGNLFDGKKATATQGFITWTPAATNYRCTPKDTTYAIGTEDCTHTGGGGGKSVHATEVIPDDSTTIGTVSNVKNAIVYGTYTGTLAGGGKPSGSVQ